jgi:hypothetical protein
MDVNSRVEAGDSLRTIQIICIIALGVAAGCIPTLQPILLGGLQAAGRISAAQIGQSAMAEAMGMGLATTFAAILLKPAGMKRIATLALIISCLANLGTAFVDHALVMVLRGLSGACSGMLLWILVGMFARAQAPGRLFAIYMTVQALVALLLTALISRLVLPAMGPGAGYLTLALLNIALLPAAFLVPAAYRMIDAATRGMPPLHGIIALLSVATFLSGIMAFWVYVLPIGRARGFSTDALNDGLLLAVLFQIAGGLTAAFSASRLPPRLVCVTGALVAICCILGVLMLEGDLILWVSLAVFAFFWMFIPPFQMPLLIGFDPSLRTAMLIGSAQLLGSAVGPLLASLVISNDRILAAGWAAVGCMLLSVLGLIGAGATQKMAPGKIAAPLGI